MVLLERSIAMYDEPITLEQIEARQREDAGAASNMILACGVALFGTAVLIGVLFAIHFGLI